MAREPDLFIAPDPDPLWRSVAKSEALTQAKRSVLRAIIELGASSSDGRFTRHQFAAWLENQSGNEGLTNVSPGHSSRMLAQLANEGALKHAKGPAGRNIYELTGQADKFVLNATRAANLSSKVAKSRRGEANLVRRLVAHQRQNLLASTQLEFLEGTPATYYGERLIHGILDAAVRTGRADRRKEIRTRYGLPVPGQRSLEWIDIRTLCRSGEDSEIFELSDLSVITVLNSRFVVHVTEKYGPDANPEVVPNLFAFDVFDLCAELGLPTKMRPEVVKRLQRLRDTVFQIDVEKAPAFQSALGIEGWGIFEYQYLTEFMLATEEVTEEEGGELEQLGMFDGAGATVENGSSHATRRVPRFYMVKFHTRMFIALLEQARTQRFVVHPQLRTERLGIVHRFYNWSKAYIGVRPRFPRPESVEYLIDEFHQVCLPAAHYQTFEADLIRMARRFLLGGEGEWNPQGINRALVYGYYLEIDYTPEGRKAYQDSMPRNRPVRRSPGRTRTPAVVRIWRDPLDPLIGDNSAHNLALRQQQLRALKTDATSSL